jgi:flagellar hook-associated protein 1 FlgK
MSLGSLLSVARTALLTYQRAMDVTGHNVANAQTPGYSRQRARLQAETPLWTPQGLVGRGVTIGGIERARDTFLDAAFRHESGLLGHSGTLADLLGRVESAINEPSDSGVSSALDAMFAAFSDLANDPASVVNRNLVRQTAERFTQQLRHVSAELGQVSTDTVQRLGDQVGEVNALAQKIADLNTRILAVGAGQGAPDLEDQRDLMVDQLSSLMGVRALTRDDGTVSLMAGDTLLVDGGSARTLELRSLPGGGFALGLAGGATLVDPQSGSLKALMDMVNTLLPGLRAKLDQFALAVVTEVNALHRSGFTATGLTGVDFFAATGVTAATIGLSADVTASSDAIAAGATPSAGDGAMALQLAQLGRANVASLGGKSLRDWFTDVASGVGVDSRDAAQDAETGLALVDHADAQRLSVSGVSVDEEMTLLISQQQAYGAAARLIKVAEEMMQDLLQMI